ncbi:DUF6559 family protein [Vibrio atlanticus]|uniref:Uncharacterized protein n=1 Tax=Vibrio atlanticus TaxID=693153 RepID=A0A1C3IMY9_9VIBR|nr:DUF6559 family protein [Vibrio atlanticus]SBS62759.1 hypothetical protein VAT7223_01319 [Vibrio atlanticus]
MFRYIQRRRIKKVIKSLSAKLVKAYGSSDFFSIGQVETSSCELSKRQQLVALALFADPQNLAAEIAPAIQLLRNDVSNDFFGGEEYNARDVLNLLGGGGWKGGRMDDDMSNRFGMNSRY